MKFRAYIPLALACVSQTYAQKLVTVAQDGSGDYRTVQQAIDNAPATGAAILIKPGTYKEHITVDKPSIQLNGLGRTPADVVLTAKDKIPDFRDITLRNVRVLTPGKITLDGFNDAHRLGIRFDNIALDSQSPITQRFADLETLPGKPNSCDGKFIPIPTPKGETP